MAFGIRGEMDRDAFIHYVDELQVPDAWKQEAKLIKLAENPFPIQQAKTKGGPKRINSRKKQDSDPKGD